MGIELAYRGQVRRIAVLEPVASFLPILAVALIVSLSWCSLGAGRTSLPSLSLVLALQLNVRLGGCWQLECTGKNSGRCLLLIKSRDADKQFRRLAVPF